ncbi:MAG TPA: hypothetical protein ENK57_23880 [Polyangiaceae bacterium]|nr:hypothetical protein [Polyangiaceae bacterium]
MTFYFLLTGAFPFPGTHRRQIRERIEWRPASPLEVYGVDEPDLQALLDRLFKPDEVLRLVSARLLLRALIRLEPDAEGLPELGTDLEELKAAVHNEEEGIAEPYPDVVESVHALLGDPDGSSTSLLGGDLPRGPMATLPQMALDDEERAAIVDAIAPKRRASDPDEPAAEAPARPSETPQMAVRETEMSLPGLFDERADGESEIAETVPPSRGVPAETSAREPSGSPWADRPKPAKTGAPKRGANLGLWIAVGLLGAFAAALIAVPGFQKSIVSFVTDRDPVPTAPPSSVSTKPPAPAPKAVPKPRPTGVTPATSSPVVLGEERDACVADLFPDDTFAGSKPRFDFVCAEEDPRKAADAMRVEIVLGKGRRTVTEAMKTWTELGWYQLAFVAVARTRCCPDEVGDMQSELGGAPCRYDASLSDLGHAVVHGDDEHLDEALEDYATAVNCLADAPTKDVYGFERPAGGDEPSLFRKVIAPLRPAR